MANKGIQSGFGSYKDGRKALCGIRVEAWWGAGRLPAVSCSLSPDHPVTLASAWAGWTAGPVQGEDTSLAMLV